MKLSEIKVKLNATHIRDRFMLHNNSLTMLELPKVEHIGDSFMFWNESLEELSLPNVVHIGSYFMTCNDLPSRITFLDTVTIN